MVGGRTIGQVAMLLRPCADTHGLFRSFNQINDTIDQKFDDDHIAFLKRCRARAVGLASWHRSGSAWRLRYLVLAYMLDPVGSCFRGSTS